MSPNEVSRDAVGMSDGQAILVSTPVGVHIAGIQIVGPRPSSVAQVVKLDVDEKEFESLLNNDATSKREFDKLKRKIQAARNTRLGG